MDWLVRLGGDEWSLQGLAEALPTEPRVWKDDDGHYYLSSSSLTACADDDEAWREAELTVGLVNDAAMGLDLGHRPIVTQAVVCVGDDGSRRALARASGTAHALARVRASGMAVRSDGTVIPPGPSTVEQLYLALKKEGDQSELAYALRAWRSGTRDWRVLYNVYESIKYDLSGGKGKQWQALQAVTPPDMTWPELDKELRRFRGTANDRRYGGLAARHGRPEPKPISDPMSLGEADDLTRRLLATWIKTKI